MVQRRPALGYIMVAFAATLFAVNGTVSKVILGSGIGSGELTEVRCAGAVVGLALIAAVTRPSSLRAQLGDLPLLVALGRRHPTDLARGSENPWRQSSCPVPYLAS
jgi:drug/metabolite transporter (DMT)-like permease